LLYARLSPLDRFVSLALARERHAWPVAGGKALVAAQPEHGSEAAAVDVAAFIDSRPLGGFQLRVALLCASVLFLESFDSNALGYIVPMLARIWHVGPGSFGPIFASGFFGQLIGAVIAGPVADRIGRKAVLVAATLEFAVGALLTTQVDSPGSLFAIRLVTGLGIGAALPNAVALTN
jgi:AAHS family 4-hydroxybenzoate transporter-like MFS transporter